MAKNSSGGQGILSTQCDEKAELAALVDESYRVFHSRLLPGVKNIMGVRVPMLWKLARRLAKEEGAAYLLRACDDTYEEIMLQGMVICLLKEEPERTLERLPAYMAKIDNWAECDIICSGLKSMKKARKECLEFLKPYLSSEKEFEVRFAAVLLLDYFIDERYIAETLRLLDGIRHPGYYVKMAVAWAVSVCYVKFPEETMRYLTASPSPGEGNTLDDFTYNKALQKIAESYQVDKETKALIRSMKRKISIMET